MKTVLHVCLLIILFICIWLLALHQEVKQLEKTRIRLYTDSPVYTVEV